MKRQEKDEESQEYQLLAELEQFESLREDMEELGVRSLVEVEARIAELHAKLDELE